MKKLMIVCLLILAGACSKFEHAELDAASACELCDWAEEREGVYTGVMYWDSSSVLTPVDTVVFEVDQVFLNQSNYDDSTRIYFDVTESWQSSGNVFSWRASATDSTEGLAGANSYYFFPKGDSVKVSKTQYGPGWIVSHIEGVFYR